jgi:molybdopterin-guanine dinucleotide biosynthesis protein A
MTGTTTFAGVAGAVLTGGRSSRMGRDKALIEVDGRAMAVRVAAALGRAGCAPVIGIGGDATGLAAAGLAAAGVDVVADWWPGQGPLGAIITALLHVERARPGAATVVAACDLPWLDAETVADLLPPRHVAQAPFDAIVAVTDRDQPLCTCWMPDALAVLQRHFDDGERAVHAAWTDLRRVRVPVAAAALRNVNAPEDLPTP